MSKRVSCKSGLYLIALLINISLFSMKGNKDFVWLHENGEVVDKVLSNQF